MLWKHSVEKFQKSIISCSKLYVALNVIKSLTVFIISMILIITLPSMFTEHTLPTCLLVLSQLQMKATGCLYRTWCYSWFQISMDVLRACSQLLGVPHAANHKPDWWTVGLGAGRHPVSQHPILVPFVSSTLPCEIGSVFTAQLEESDPPYPWLLLFFTQKAWDLNEVYKRAVLVKGENKFAMQKFKTPLNFR